MSRRIRSFSRGVKRPWSREDRLRQCFSVRTERLEEEISPVLQGMFFSPFAFLEADNGDIQARLLHITSTFLSTREEESKGGNPDRGDEEVEEPDILSAATDEGNLVPNTSIDEGVTAKNLGQKNAKNRKRTQESKRGQNKRKRGGRGEPE